MIKLPGYEEMIEDSVFLSADPAESSYRYITLGSYRYPSEKKIIENIREAVDDISSLNVFSRLSEELINLPDDLLFMIGDNNPRFLSLLSKLSKDPYHLKDKDMISIIYAEHDSIIIEDETKYFNYKLQESCEDRYPASFIRTEILLEKDHDFPDLKTIKSLIENHTTRSRTMCIYPDDYEEKKSYENISMIYSSLSKKDIYKIKDITDSITEDISIEVIRKILNIL